MTDFRIVNWSILKSPLSWLTIFLMVLIAGIALHLVMDHFNVNPATSQDGNS